MAFDIEGARLEGYSDSDIARHLSGTSNFDYEGAIGEGYTDEDILGHLTTEPAERVAAPVVEPIAPPPITPVRGVEDRTVFGTAKDVGISALKGAIALPQAAVGLLDIPTGGYAGKLLADAGYRPQEAQRLLDTYLSPSQQAANKEVAEAEGFLPTIEAAIKHPSTILSAAIESAPSMLGGAGIARGALKVLPKLSPLVAAAIGEGVVATGAVVEQIRGEAETGLVTPKQSLASVAAGLGTGALSLVGGRLAQKVGVADADTLLAGGGAGTTEKGVIRRVLEGGVTEGLFEELPQSAQEQVWMNAAQDRPLLEGVGKQSAMGLLAGAAIGGGFNVFRTGTGDVDETQGEIADKYIKELVFDGQITKDEGDVVLSGFAEAITPDTTPDESAQVLDTLLAKSGVGVEAPEVAEAKVAAARENIKAKASEVLDTIDPETDLGQQVKGMLQDELAKAEPAPVVVEEAALPEAEIIDEVPVLEEALPEAEIIEEAPVVEELPEIEVLPEEVAPEIIPEAEILPEEELPEVAEVEAPAVTPEPIVEEPVVEEEPPFAEPPFELKTKEGVAELDDLNRQILEAIKVEVEAGEAGSRIVTKTNGDLAGSRIPSTFPEYFQNKGYKKKPTIIAINKALKGKKLAPGQELIVRDLHQGYVQTRPAEIAALEEITVEAPAVEKAPEGPERVKIGKSPQTYEVVREIEATPEEIELGERFFEIKNEKTGEVQEVAFDEMKPVKKRVVSDDALDKAQSNIKEKFKGLKSGIDPTLLKDYTVVGAYHFESGFRTFSAWSKKMIEEFGDIIKPHLKNLWGKASRGKTPVTRPVKKKAPSKVIKKEVKPKVVAPAAKKAAPKKAPDVKPISPEETVRMQELRKRFAQNITGPSLEETLELADKESKLPKKKFGDHRDYSGEQKEALSKIGVKPKSESFSSKLNKIRENLGTTIRQKMVDQYASLKDISEQGHILAVLSNTSTGALEAAFKHGKIRLTKDGAITVDETGKGFASVLSPLGEELDDFLGWIAGNRAKNLKGQDRERLFSDEDIESLISLSEGTMADGKRRKPVYNKVLRDLNAFQNSMVDIAVQTGTINKEERESWNKDFYVPFYRVLDEAEGVKGPRTLDALAGQTAVKRLKGADVPLNDILQNILMNWNHLLNASLKNQAAVFNLEAAEQVAAATQIKEKDKTKNSVFVRKDGKKIWYDIHEPLILESISSLSHEGFNSPSMRAMRKFKRAFTMGVTASPEFRIANLMRDTIHSVAVGKTKYNMLDNVFGKGWSGTKKDSLTRARMLAGGGEIHFGHLYGTDPEGAKLLIQKGIKSDTILDNPKAFNHLTTAFKAGWDTWNEFGSRLENVNRAALYENRVKEVGHLRASFEARDLMNFTSSGAASSIRFLTQVVPFLNARMQGLDKMARSLSDKDQRNQFVITTGGVMLASIALYLAFKDDEDFKEREQWDRDTYWWFKFPGSKTAFRLPKPFEVGALGTMAERMAEQIVDDKVHGELFAERLMHMISETFSFSIVPQMIQPTLDIYANKNPFTKRPIETLGLQRLSPTERKKAWTSETAIGLSNAMDKVSWGKVVLSPVQIEHLVQGYLGWIGATGLGIVDKMFARQFGEFPVEPARRIEDYPAIGRFVRRQPQRNTKYATLFYEQMQEMNEAYNDIQNFRKLGEIEKARELKANKRGQLKLRKYFNSVQKKLNKISRRLKRIHASKEMTAEEKRNQIDLLTIRKNRLTRIAIERTEFIKERDQGK